MSVVGVAKSTIFAPPHKIALLPILLSALSPTFMKLNVNKSIIACWVGIRLNKVNNIYD